MLAVIILCAITAEMLAMGIYLIVIGKQRDGLYFYDFRETRIVEYIVLAITMIYIITTLVILGYI
jgi:hypothetical protein